MAQDGKSLFFVLVLTQGTLLSGVAAGILAASLLGSGPFGRAIEAAAAWTTSGPRLPLASDSVWQLRQSGLNMIGR